MIRKEAAKFDPQNAREAYGQAAEADMAFYLRRAFAESKNVHVFNDLCIEHNGERAQFDHLVLHRAVMIVVESKSVTSSVRINERGEWSRVWEEKWFGIPSPLQQAQAQIELLWGILDHANTELLGKMLGAVQRGFGGYKYDVFVAISTRGIVERPTPAAYPNVVKADQVCDQVWELICKHRSHASAAGLVKNALNLLNWGRWDKQALFEFSDNEFQRISDFLLGLHVERTEPGLKLAPAPPVASKPLTSDLIIVPDNLPPNPTESMPASCVDCSAQLRSGVESYCRSNARRFGGRVFCMSCQKKY